MRVGPRTTVCGPTRRRLGPHGRVAGGSLVRCGRYLVTPCRRTSISCITAEGIRRPCVRPGLANSVRRRE
jgi:hypothetical protein